ncbi:MAG: protein phosphatase [Cyanobium sp. PLM2.Bin73]|nr:MAG: protein phosphatase [Cyanobium sp. PLM2.Bin73]
MSDPADLQATLVDFALAELVRQHRESFQPLWSTDSWAKLLIWLALNCGCSGDQDGLRAFAEALGPVLSRRLRRVFFERELVDLDLQVMADPAEPQVLVLPLGPGAGPLPLERAATALERLGLLERVAAERECWSSLERALSIPWRSAAPGAGSPPVP